METHRNPEMVLPDNFEKVTEGQWIARYGSECHRSLMLIKQGELICVAQFQTTRWLDKAVKVVCEG